MGTNINLCHKLCADSYDFSSQMDANEYNTSKTIKNRRFM